MITYGIALALREAASRLRRTPTDQWLPFVRGFQEEIHRGAGGGRRLTEIQDRRLGSVKRAQGKSVGKIARFGDIKGKSGATSEGALEQAVRTHQRGRGRPRKFLEPTRAVTLTLPVRVIQALEAVDPDLSRAVVRLIEPAASSSPIPPVELAFFGRRAVIVVRSCRTLERRTGIDLVPLPDGRALISFAHPLTAEGLELVIADALEDATLPGGDRAVFSGIADLLRSARRSHLVAVQQRNIVLLEGLQRKRRARKGEQRRGEGR